MAALPQPTAAAACSARRRSTWMAWGAAASRWVAEAWRGGHGRWARQVGCRQRCCAVRCLCACQAFPTLLPAPRSAWPRTSGAATPKLGPAASPSSCAAAMGSACEGRGGRRKGGAMRAAVRCVGVLLRCTVVMPACCTDWARRCSPVNGTCTSSASCCGSQLYCAKTNPSTPTGTCQPVSAHLPPSMGGKTTGRAQEAFPSVLGACEQGQADCFRGRRSHNCHRGRAN